MLVGQKSNGACQPVGNRRRIPQTAPVHTREVWRHHLRQTGGQTGLANAADAQNRNQPTLLVDHPTLDQRQFVGAANEVRGVKRVTPVLSVVGRQRYWLRRGPPANRLAWPRDRGGCERGEQTGKPGL